MNKTQKGFAALEGILILIVIAIIGGIGWYALHTKHQTDKILSQADKISQTTPTITSSKKTNQAAEKSQKYLTIKEFGVKIPLTDTIKDAYYTPGERGNNYYNLRVHSLDSEDNCTNGDLSVAAIERATPAEYQQSQNSDGAGNSTPQNSSKIGDYYYYIIHAQYDCSQSKSNDGIVIPVEKAFTDQTPNIQAE